MWAKSLKNLTKQLGLPSMKLANARHTLANQLKRNNVDREIVKDMFGHTSIHTLDNYYESFHDDEHRKIASNYISIASIKSQSESKKAS